MSFSVTYHQLTTYNIRNLYGGLPQDIRWRTHQVHNRAITPTQRNIELQKRPPDRFEIRSYEYDPQFNIHVHKAPAFRSLTRANVNEIVNRLSQPRTRTPRHFGRGETKSPVAVNSPRRNERISTPSTPRSSRSTPDLDNLYTRLQRPTTSARIRNISRTWSDCSIHEIQTACNRRDRPPSSRLELTPPPINDNCVIRVM